MKEKMTREVAIHRYGIDAVRTVEAIDCQPTNRYGFCGECAGDDLTEWSASMELTDKDGDEVTLIAYYYTTNEDDDILAAGGNINWEVDHFIVD